MPLKHPKNGQKIGENDLAKTSKKSGGMEKVK